MLVINNLRRSLVIFIIHIRIVKNPDTFINYYAFDDEESISLFHTLHNNFLFRLPDSHQVF